MEPKAYSYLLGIFVGVLIASNVMAATKLVSMSFLGYTFIVPVAVIAYAITFPITDVAGEVWGKEAANRIVRVGFVAQVFVLILYLLGWPLPALKPEMQEIYNTVFGLQPRIVLASLTAYLVSQHHDVWAFHFWKKVTKGRHLWLRNNASTVVSQLIDSSIFITLAFYGVFPDPVVFSMIITQWLVKVGIALMDTPFVYLLSWRLQRQLVVTIST